MNHNYPKCKIEDFLCPNHPNSREEITDSQDDGHNDKEIKYFPNNKEAKKIDFNKLYNKLNLQNLANNEANIKYITEQFFGDNNQFSYKEINEEAKQLQKKDNKELHQKRINENYLFKFCPPNKQKIIRDCISCQFCIELKISKFAFQNMTNKYKTTLESYNVKVINDIIYNENTNVVSIFKDFLIYDDTSEFLKRFYNSNESKPRLPKIFEFYTTHSKFSPTTFHLSEGRIIYKHKKKVKSHNEEKQDEANKKNKKRASSDFFGDDDKIFTTKFLEELNRPDSDDEMNSINQSNSIIRNLYNKGMKQSFKKQGQSKRKDDLTIHNLVKQIGEGDSQMFKSIVDQTRFNNSIEKNNGDIIKEMEKHKENEARDFNVLKRNNTLKNEFRLTKPSSTSKDTLALQNKNLQNTFKKNNFQTKSNYGESKVDQSKKNTSKQKELIELLLTAKKKLAKNFKEVEVHKGLKKQKMEPVKSNVLKHKEINSIGILMTNNPSSTKDSKIEIKHNIKLKLNEDISRKISNHVWNQKNNNQEKQIFLTKKMSQPEIIVQESIKKNDLFGRKFSQVNGKKSNIQSEITKNLKLRNNQNSGSVISMNFSNKNFLNSQPSLRNKNNSITPRNILPKNVIYKPSNNMKKRQISTKEILKEEMRNLKSNKIFNRRFSNPPLSNQILISKFDHSKGFTNIVSSPSNSNHKISLINNLFINNNYYGLTKRNSMPFSKKRTSI